MKELEIRRSGIWALLANGGYLSVMKVEGFKGTYELKISNRGDLRGKLIASYRDVVNLFFMDEEIAREIEEERD